MDIFMSFFSQSFEKEKGKQKLEKELLYRSKLVIVVSDEEAIPDVGSLRVLLNGNCYCFN